MEEAELEKTPPTIPTTTTTTTCTVIGGRSYPVGRSLVLRLLRSHWGAVRIADSHPSLQIEEGEEEDQILSDAIRDGRAMYFQVDVRDKWQVMGAVSDTAVVFLMDIVGTSTLDFHDQYMLIVQGTKNVLSACRECKVERLIYNSSADVVFDGLHDIKNGNESLPYPCKYTDALNDLKSQAEALVLFANGKDGLLTCALRPSNTFGPRDVHIVKFLLDEAKSGRAKFIVGSDGTFCDFTYVENVAHAHTLAEKALCSGTTVAGKPFFITNHEPMKLMEFISLVLEGWGHQRPKIVLPVRLILFIAMIMEWVHGKLRLQRRTRSCLTPAILRSFSCTRTFDCSQAQKFIGYTPIVSVEEGIMLTAMSFPHMMKQPSFINERNFSTASKAEKLLGGGGVSEVLLWRDEKKTFSYLFGLFFLFYWFLVSGRTLITSMAKLLLFLMMILFVHGKLPSSICGFNVKRIPAPCFRASERAVKDAIKSTAFVWNQGIRILMSVQQGTDGGLFLKVAGSIYFFRFILQFSIATLIGAGLVILFSLFIIYEQFEVEIDNSLAAAAVHAEKLRDSVMKRLPGFLKEYIH